MSDVHYSSTGQRIIQCIICMKDIEHRQHNGVVYWTEGNNAQPVADGRCCDACDCMVVIPYRMGELIGDTRSAIYFGLQTYKERISRYDAGEEE